MMSTFPVAQKTDIESCVRKLQKNWPVQYSVEKPALLNLVNLVTIFCLILCEETHCVFQFRPDILEFTFSI